MLMAFVSDLQFMDGESHLLICSDVDMIPFIYLPGSSAL